MVRVRSNLLITKDDSEACAVNAKTNLSNSDMAIKYWILTFENI